MPHALVVRGLHPLTMGRNVMIIWGFKGFFKLFYFSGWNELFWIFSIPSRLKSIHPLS